MDKLPPQRGRPRSIDTDKAMDAIVEAFRARGYAATSLDDLSEAAALSRPSLYRNFGGKQDMYLAAMDRFEQQAGEAVASALLTSTSVQNGLTAFFKAMLDTYFRNAEIIPGCLVFGTAPSATEDGQIQSRLAASISSLENGLDRWLREQTSSNAADRRILVEIITNTLIAMSARSRSGTSQKELMAIGRRCAKHVAGQCSG